MQTVCREGGNQVATRSVRPLSNNQTEMTMTEIARPTFTTVPTRVRLYRGMRLVQFLQDTHAMASRMVNHQHLGLQHIKRLNEDCDAACGLQNLLVIQADSPESLKQEKQQGHEADWDFQAAPLWKQLFTHPLVLECNISDTAIEAIFHCNERVLSAWHTKRLVHQFEAVLKRLADRSEFVRRKGRLGFADQDGLAVRHHGQHQNFKGRRGCCAPILVRPCQR